MFAQRLRITLKFNTKKKNYLASTIKLACIHAHEPLIIFFLFQKKFQFFLMFLMHKIIKV